MDETSKTTIAARLAGETAPAGASGAHEDALAPGEEGEGDNILRHVLPDQHLLRIAVERLAPATEGQARQDFNEDRLQALAESLKRSGVREPIIVTPHGAEPGRYQIVAGERRWRAARLAGLQEIPCIVDPGLLERKDKLLAQAEENLHRENLNAVEEAAVLAQLMEARGIDVKEAGELLGKSQRQARRLLQLHAAAAPIKRAVARGQVDARAALELVRVHNRFAREDASPSGVTALKRIERLVERYVGEGWTMRKLERYAARLDARSGEREPGREELDESGERPAPPAPRMRKAVEAPVAPPGQEVSRPALGPVLERRGGHLVLDVGRIERHELSPEERATLIEVFEDLLFKARRA